MIEILTSPDHVVALRLSGRLTEADYDRAIAEVEAKLARHERIGVLADLVDFEDLTAAAGWKDLRYGLSRWGDLKRFPREAVVSDKQWVRVLVGLANPLVPHVELRNFGSHERDVAMAWAAALPPR